MENLFNFFRPRVNNLCSETPTQTNENRLPTHDELSNTVKRLMNVKDPNLIIKKIEKLLNKMPAKDIFDCITEHYYKSNNSEDDFKNALIKMKKLELAILRKLFGVDRADMSGTAFDKLADAFILRHSQLDLYFESVNRLPDSIGNLYNLQRLNLSANQLSSVPDSIGNLYNLQRLDLSRNQLSSVPDSIGNLYNLQWLNLSANQLRSVPDSIGNLYNLQWLYLANNQLRSVPDSIWNLSNLQRLDLYYNNLTIAQIQRIRDIFATTQIRVYASLRDAATVSTHQLQSYDNQNLVSQVESLKKKATENGITFQQANTSNTSIWSELNKPENNTFKAFLDKIWQTNDGRDNSGGKKIMLNSLMNIFTRMESSAEYRQLCLNIAEESIGTCGDRVALGLVEMQLARNGFPEHTPSLQELFSYEKSSAKADIIFQIARKQIDKVHGVIDEIEVYLKYLKEFKNEIGIDIGDMLYGATANVGDEEIKNAQDALEQVTDDMVYLRLVENTVVKNMFAEHFEKIRNSPKFDNTLPLRGESDIKYKERLEKYEKEILSEQIKFLKDKLQ